MTIRFLSAVLAILGLLPIAGSAEPLPQPELILQRVQLWDTAALREPGAIPFSIASPILHTSFRTTSFAAPSTWSRLKDLVPDSERPRTKGILAASSWLKGQFNTEGEVANNAVNDAGMPERIDLREDGSKRMVRFAFSGTHEMFRYGATYRSAGKAFFNSPDQTMREVWGEWGLGVARLRSSIGQVWNNVDLDPARSRIEQSFNRLGLALGKPSWPALTLTYSRSTVTSRFDPSGTVPQKTQSHGFEAALDYSGLTWTAKLASSYVLTKDEMQNGAESRAIAQSFAGVFRPLNTLTLSPTVSYRAETQEWSGARIQTPSASLSVLYKQSQRLLVSATGGYTSSVSTDRLIDTVSVLGKGMFAYHLNPIYGRPAMVSLEAAYTNTSHRTASSVDTEDLSGLVRLLIASL